MGLSYSTIQETYKIFNELKQDFLPDLQIPSFPQDIQGWEGIDKDNPPLNRVFGWDRKHDSGWENIFFFVEKPSAELIDAFKIKAQRIGNSILCSPHNEDDERIWVIGWF